MYACTIIQAHTHTHVRLGLIVNVFCFHFIFHIWMQTVTIILFLFLSWILFHFILHFSCLLLTDGGLNTYLVVRKRQRWSWTCMCMCKLDTERNNFIIITQISFWIELVVGFFFLLFSVLTTIAFMNRKMSLSTNTKMKRRFSFTITINIKQNKKLFKKNFEIK